MGKLISNDLQNAGLIIMQLLMVCGLWAQDSKPVHDNSESLKNLSSLELIATLPSHAIHLDFHEDYLIACLGLKGTAWLDVSEISETQNHPDSEITALPELYSSTEILTLDIDLVLDQYLFTTDRQSGIRVFELPEESTDSESPDNTSAPASALFQKQILEVPVEGSPIRIDSSENFIAIAGGGAGVSFFEFEPKKMELNLVSRYPFPDYVRDVTFLNPNTVAATDVHSYKVHIIDVSDHKRPIKVIELSAGAGFYDQVFSKEDTVLSYTRSGKIFAFDMKDEFSELIQSRVEDIATLYGIKRTATINDADLIGSDIFIMEKHDGLSRIRVDDPEFEIKALLDFEEPMISMVAHPDGKILFLSSISGNVWMYRIP